MFLLFNCYHIPQLSYKFKRLAISLHHIILMVKIMLTFVEKIYFILINVILFFFLSEFSFTDTDNSQDSRGREGTILFHSTTSTRAQTFRHLFATLNVRWLSHIFNRNTCIYLSATRWDLPPYRITIWMIDDVILIFVCLHVELISGCATAIWYEKPVNSNSHRLSFLYYKRTN